MATSIETKWPTSKIRDLCDISRGSSPRPIADQRYFEGGHIPWIKIADATKSGKFLYETKEYVNEYGASFSRLLPAGTILVAASGTLGYTQILGVPGCAHDGWLILTNLRNFDRDYAYYVLQQMQRHFYNSAYGAAIQNINTEILRETEIPCPPLPTQRKIAAILSAYDDLIENNLRRIKLLEEMAQNLYREWFVKFRFPGHEDVPMVDSPLGLIPEGWEVATVENTFAILGGGTPSKPIREYWDGGTINWYSPTDLTATGSMFMEHSGNQISELGLKKSSARLFPAFSVMMTSRATLGVISINTTDACTNQGFITCIPNERFPLYSLYYWLKGNVEYFISLGTGATFKEITKGVFKTIELIVPAKAIVTQFENIMQPFGLEILNLQRKNNILRRTRDLLLPRLISGEVDVSALNIAVREEVET